MSWTMMIIVMIFIFFVEWRLRTRLQQLQASLFKLPPWSHNLRTRCQNKKTTFGPDLMIGVLVFYLIQQNVLLN